MSCRLDMCRCHALGIVNKILTRKGTILALRLVDNGNVGRDVLGVDCLQQGASSDRGIQLLPFDGRSPAELTGRYLDVLGMQRMNVTSSVVRW